MRLQMLDNSIFKSKNNFERALLEIGKRNPYGIRKLSLVSHKRIDPNIPFKKKDIIKLGELNIYRCLNGSLGLGKQYSLSKIRKIKQVKVKNHNDGNLSQYLYSVNIPYNEYTRIVRAVSSLLHQSNCHAECVLEQIETNDKYCGKNAFKNKALHRIVPIQTGIIMCSSGRTKNKQIILDKLQERIEKMN